MRWNGLRAGRQNQDQWQYQSVVLRSLIVLLIFCGLACNRQESPQILFDRVYGTFQHGDLEKAQIEAARQYQRFRDSDPELAWRFRLLEAKALLWRGMFNEVLRVLDSSTSPKVKDSQIEILALKGTVLARLHRFPEAAQAIAHAAPMCQPLPEISCGDLLLADGVLALQQGEPNQAKTSFGNALEFGQRRKDDFLQATASLNLGAVSLAEEHFDETIDWTDTAYQAAAREGFGNTTRTALCNLGWAYYKLGELNKALELNLEGEKQSHQAGNVVQGLYCTTNLGYVYASQGDLPRAKQAYLSALDHATKIASKEGIYNAQRALALVFVADGELDEAHKYSSEAIETAQNENNRTNELYPLLVQGLIAAQTHDDQTAESIFREVENDAHSTANLKWRSEYGLARLYESKQRTQDANGAYRAAITTFENARFSLRRDQTRLPFFGNASQIYGDYVTFMIAHGKSDDALRWADHSRARTLAEGLGEKTAVDPPLLKAKTTAKNRGGTILFYWLGDKRSYLWAATPNELRRFDLPAKNEIEAVADRYRKALGGPQDVFSSSNSDGRWLYENLLAPAESMIAKGSKVFVVPDGSLTNLNFETIVVPGPRPHFWIEDATVISASSLHLLENSRTLSGHGHNLLLIGNSVAPNDKYPELSKAGDQVNGVANHFSAGSRQVITREQATPSAYLNSKPERFSFIHFVAHGTASRSSPLDSAIILSRDGQNSDSFKLYARDIIQHPLRADLVTISACYGAGEMAYTGEGLVGLSWAFLRAGAHNVIAALWEATDVSTEQLMARFYDELDKGTSPAVALRNAKLALLRETPYRSPFYWAPFQLYAGS
jgi:CHAT domain-containing protein